MNGYKDSLPQSHQDEREARKADSSRPTPDVSNRILHDVTDHIQRMMDSSQRFQRPLKTMANDLGYSHSSIHRALDKLESLGEIQIDRSSQPHAVTYIGTLKRTRESQELQTAELLADTEKLVRRLSDHILTLTEDNKALRKASAEWLELAPCITDVVDLPGKDQLVVYVDLSKSRNPGLLLAKYRKS
jgi:DNA-binding MarR family transcriptional regulator